MSRSRLLVVAVFCCITSLFVGCLPPQYSVEEVKWEEENPNSKRLYMQCMVFVL